MKKPCIKGCSPTWLMLRGENKGLCFCFNLVKKRFHSLSLQTIVGNFAFINEFDFLNNMILEAYMRIVFSGRCYINAGRHQLLVATTAGKKCIYYIRTKVCMASVTCYHYILHLRSLIVVINLLNRIAHFPSTSGIFSDNLS